MFCEFRQLSVLGGPLDTLRLWQPSTRSGQEPAYMRLGGNCGTPRRNHQVSDDTEMVAGPHAVYWFVEHTRAGGDLEGRPVVSAAHEDVVDPSERPVGGSHQRVVRRVCVARISGMGALPSVPVAHAHAAQGLAATPEAHAGRIGIGIEVTGHHHVHTAPINELLHEPRSGNGLKLPLILEVQVVRGQVVDKQQRPDGLWSEDLSDERRAREVRRPGCHVQVHFLHICQWPAAGYRGAVVVSVAYQTCVVVGDVEVRVEQIDDLIGSWNATRSGRSSRKPSTSTDRRSAHAPLRPHRLSVATRTPSMPVTFSIANLPSRLPPCEPSIADRLNADTPVLCRPQNLGRLQKRAGSRKDRRQRAPPYQLYKLTTSRRSVSPSRLARSRKTRWRWSSGCTLVPGLPKCQ